ncbi:MAG: tandem-95 repeat protein [Gammaproteobacteria bacterium]|nr:tandem-95 repeat protein [Gammaproteobacteria bacterium]
MQPGNSNVVIAGINGSGGLERSVNGGGVWASESTGDAVTWVLGFSVLPDASTVYVGGSNNLLGTSGRLLKSSNSGDTWNSLTVAGDSSPNILSVAVDPSNSNIAYAGVLPQSGSLFNGLYKTVDGGDNWSDLAALSALGKINALAIDPNDSNLIYAGSSFSDQIFRSTDGGTTWTRILFAAGLGFSNFKVRGIAIDPDDSRVIYTSGGNNPTNVLASSDCGASWRDVSNGLNVSAVVDVRIDTVNNYVYVLDLNALGSGLYRETLGAGGLPAPSGTCPSGSGGNTAPVAVNDNVNATEDVALVSATDLDFNDTDADGDPLTVMVENNKATAQGGDIDIAADGSYTYTPVTNFNGNDSVNYTVTDGSLSDVGTLTIAVAAVDDPPVAVDDAIVANRSTPFNSTTDLDANDQEVDGEALTVMAEAGKATAAGGVINIAADGSYTYTPLVGYVGADSVDYTVMDGANNDTGTLNITVAVGSGGPPVAVDDNDNATEDTQLAGASLVTNDNDPEADPLFAVPGTFPTAQGGSIDIVADGTFTYTPALNFNGNDSVDYTVTDGGGSDVGTLTIAVGAIDDPPVAVDDAIMVTVDTVFNSSTDLDANDQEFDGEALTVVDETGKATAQAGEIDIAADGSYTYRPPAGFVGNDNVNYTVMDAANNDVGTLNITVTAAPTGGNPGGGDPGGGDPGGNNPGEDTSPSSSGSSLDFLFSGFLALLLLLRGVRHVKLTDYGKNKT